MSGVLWWEPVPLSWPPGHYIYSYRWIWDAVPLESIALRDPLRLAHLADDGTWLARLPHDVAEIDMTGWSGVVPVYLPDPERAGWTRRKWWGRGPIGFRADGYSVTPRYFYKDDGRTLVPANCGYRPRRV